jgi:hypothetical protein
MDNWHIAATRTLIQSQFGQAQLQLANPPLKSVLDRQEYVRFHYHEVKDRFVGYVKENLTDRGLIEAIWSGDEAAEEKHQRFHVEIGAHVLACVQGLHAIADIAAHAAYYSLGLNLSATPLREAAINLASVVEEIRGVATLSRVASLLESLADGGEFKHIAALANHGKHRSLIAPGLHEDQTGKAEKRHWLQFGSFVFKGEVYPQVEVMPLLEREFNRGSRTFVDLGNEIHASLVARAAS